MRINFIDFVYKFIRGSDGEKFLWAPAVEYLVPIAQKPIPGWMINCLIIGLYLVLSLILLSHHVPWGDEAQAWLLARDCDTIPTLLAQMPYEGSPGLWHLVLFALAKLGLPYISMNVAAFLFAMAGVAVFVWFSPFTTLQKALFAFGYFTLFEYNVIARSYVLTVLLLFLAAAIYRHRFDHPLIYCSILFLLANSNLHGTVISDVITAAYAYESTRPNKQLSKKMAVAALAIACLGIALAAIQVMPPEDRSGINRMTVLAPDVSLYHIGQLFNAVVEAFLPVPQLTPWFWGTKFLYYPGTFMAFLGLPIFLLSLAFLLKKPIPLAIYLLSSLGLLSIFFLVNPGSIRHHGLIFIVFLTVLWISSEYPETRQVCGSSGNAVDAIGRAFTRSSLSTLLTAALFIQVLAASIAFYYSVNEDFSPGLKVADFLKNNGYINEDTFIATYALGTNPILPYLGPHASFYSLETESNASYVVWNDAYLLSNLSYADIMQRVDKATSGKGYENVLVILHDPVEDPAFNGRYALIASFDDAISRESYYIYREAAIGI
ncbi:hypothetical protein [Methanocella conradii]|uniref:hypothetical protein n=1 Tax=Methanocella conradii TaxID=1175444 RepID=UPI00157BEF9A|nr:hypothetical protein [Methanocella conradii]